MLSLPIAIALLGAVTGAPAADLRLDLEGSLGYQPITFRGASTQEWQETSLSAFGDLSLTIYPARSVIDDENPRALQAFLQHASSIILRGGGGGFNTSIASSTNEVTVYRGTVSATGDFYLSRSLVLPISVGYFGFTRIEKSPTETTRKVDQVPFSLGLGIHTDPIRADIIFHATPTWAASTGWTPAQAVLKNLLSSTILSCRLASGRFAEYAEVQQFGGGGNIALGLEWFKDKDLEFLAGAWGGRGRYYYDTERIYSRLGGNLGVGYWFSSRGGIKVTYSATWETSDQGTSVLNLIAVDLFLRGTFRETSAL